MSRVVDILEKLQYHESKVIYSKTVKLMQKHFELEQDMDFWFVTMISKPFAPWIIKLSSPGFWFRSGNKIIRSIQKNYDLVNTFNKKIKRLFFCKKVTDLQISIVSKPEQTEKLALVFYES